MKKVFVSAIEISGDMHAAKLVEAIRSKEKGIEFFGIGGVQLRSIGVRTLLDITNKSTIGLLEPLKHLLGYLADFRKVKKMLRKIKPNVLLCVDGQGFNLPLAKYAKSIGIKVVYYISPQEWQWGTTEGGKRVVECTDLIISIFKDEYAFYKGLGANTVFNGHPLVDIVKPKQTRESSLRQWSLNSSKKTIVVFPGSREQELRLFVPIIKKSLHKYAHLINIVFVAATNKQKAQIEDAVRGLGAAVVYGHNYDAMGVADLAICSTGTVTLEATLMKVPMIAVYRIGALSYWLLSKVAKIKLPKYKALPNILADRLIVPELIQEEFTAGNLQSNIDKFLEEDTLALEMRAQLATIAESLSAAGGVSLPKNAEAVLNLLK